MSLDDFPFHDPDWPPAVVVEREPRKCRHIRTWRTFHPDADQPAHGPLQGHQDCGQCGKHMDPGVAKRGRSSDRLGKDQERRIQKVYGPVKIGQRGDPVDHIGRVWKWQSKATRALPPKWLASIDEPMGMGALPKPLITAFVHMDGHYTDRSPVVIRCFVSRGIRTRDWLFVGWRDALAQFSLDRKAFWWVIPGDWWLDHFGRDE